MARVRFLSAFLWKPERNWAMAWPADGEFTVTRAQADAAIAAGAAVELDAPPSPHSSDPAPDGAPDTSTET